MTNCRSCDAQLSAYAKPSEKVCAPCDRRMVAVSQQHAFEMVPIERDHAAFALRWRGLEWDTIQRRLGMVSVSSATRAAGRYAKRNDLRLP